MSSYALGPAIISEDNPFTSSTFISLVSYINLLFKLSQSIEPVACDEPESKIESPENLTISSVFNKILLVPISK